MIDRHNGISAGQVRNSQLQNSRIQNSQPQNNRIQNSRTQNVTSGGNAQNNSAGSPGTPGAVSFGNMLRSELTRSPAAAQSGAVQPTVNAAQFVTNAAQSGAVQPVMHPVQNAVNSGIQFSKHALARAEERGIELTDDLMGRLASSVEKAQEKGAKNILAFDNSQAFIINIPYSRVITTMSQAEMRNNLFTNIDGAVLL